MYSVYYKNPKEDLVCFYDNSVTAFGINGANNDLALIDPVLTLEDSMAGEFNFTITEHNLAYNELERLTTIIEVWKRDKVYWRGRITEQSSDFYKQISVHAEGIMAVLNDSLMPYGVYTNIPVSEYFKILIKNHNDIMTAKGDTTKLFDMGNVTVTGTINTKTTNYENIMTLVQELVDNFGGHIQILYDHDNKQTIQWLADYSKTSSQAIQFRNNLMDYTSSFDETDFCTAVVPLGDKIKRTMGPEFFERGYLSETDGTKVANNTTMRVNHYITYMGNGNGIKIEVKTKNIDVMQISMRLYIYEVFDWNLENQNLKKVTDQYFADKINDAFTFELPFDVYKYVNTGSVGFKMVLMFDSRVLNGDEISNVYVYSDEEKLNICPLQKGIPYVVNNDTLPYHGWICKKVDFSGYKNVTNTVNDIIGLKDAAEEYLKETQFDSMNIEVTAFDLSILNPKKSIDIPIKKLPRYITIDDKYLVTGDGQYYILNRGGDNE